MPKGMSVNPTKKSLLKCCCFWFLALAMEKKTLATMYKILVAIIANGYKDPRRVLTDNLDMKKSTCNNRFLVT